MADWHRLAQHVISRRAELGYPRRPAFIEGSNLSLRTLSDIEAGHRTSYDRGTIAALEHALAWAPGSVQAVIDGGEPTPAGRSSGVPNAATASGAASVASPQHQEDNKDPAIVRVMKSGLSDDRKKQIVDILIAEKRRAEQARVERAAELIALLDGQQ